jgi:hypothetical protein
MQYQTSSLVWVGSGEKRVKNGTRTSWSPYLLWRGTFRQQHASCERA